MARQYKVLDNCPCPEVLYDELVAIKQATGVVYNSIYRGTDAEPLLRRLGKKSQRELWEGWVRRLPGYNPANPPGQSTHECYNDGVAYPGPRGLRLPAWCCGIDSTWSAGVTAEAAKRGWTVTLTYPGNPRESHHVNFRKKPLFKLLPALKLGSRGPRVAQLSRRLKYVGFYDGRVTGRFTPELDSALKHFQLIYKQNSDGVFGTQTARQLGVVVRAKKRCRRNALSIADLGVRRAALRKCSKRYGPDRPR